MRNALLMSSRVSTQELTVTITYMKKAETRILQYIAEFQRPGGDSTSTKRDISIGVVEKFEKRYSDAEITAVLCKLIDRELVFSPYPGMYQATVKGLVLIRVLKRLAKEKPETFMQYVRKTFSSNVRRLM